MTAQERLAFAISTLTEKLVQAGSLPAEDGDTIDEILTSTDDEPAADV
jgi:hypothetical protein